MAAEYSGDLAMKAQDSRQLTIYDWLDPAPWPCPRCQHVIVTREAAPRCPACGFVEGT